MTSPYAFYQFWLNCADTEASRLIKVFTLLDQEEITHLTQQHEKAPDQRILQQRLAKEVTSLVHSEAAYQQAAKVSNLLFGQATQADLLSLEEADFLTIFASIPQVKISREQLAAIEQVTDLLTQATEGLIFPSKREARRMIEEGGVSINKEKIRDPYQKPIYQPIKGKYLLVQKGKKHYYLIVVV